jgi:hypothetical protein
MLFLVPAVPGAGLAPSTPMGRLPSSPLESSTSVGGSPIGVVAARDDVLVLAAGMHITSYATTTGRLDRVDSLSSTSGIIRDISGFAGGVFIATSTELTAVRVDANGFFGATAGWPLQYRTVDLASDGPFLVAADDHGRVGTVVAGAASFGDIAWSESLGDLHDISVSGNRLFLAAGMDGYGAYDMVAGGFELVYWTEGREAWNIAGTRAMLMVHWSRDVVEDGSVRRREHTLSILTVNGDEFTPLMTLAAMVPNSMVMSPSIGLVISSGEAHLIDFERQIVLSSSRLSSAPDMIGDIVLRDSVAYVATVGHRVFHEDATEACTLPGIRRLDIDQGSTRSITAVDTPTQSVGNVSALVRHAEQSVVAAEVGCGITWLEVTEDAIRADRRLLTPHDIVQIEAGPNSDQYLLLSSTGSIIRLADGELSEIVGLADVTSGIRTIESRNGLVIAATNDGKLLLYAYPEPGSPVSPLSSVDFEGVIRDLVCGDAYCYVLMSSRIELVQVRGRQLNRKDIAFSPTKSVEPGYSYRPSGALLIDDERMVIASVGTRPPDPDQSQSYPDVLALSLVDVSDPNAPTAVFDWRSAGWAGTSLRPFRLLEYEERVYVTTNDAYVREFKVADNSVQLLREPKVASSAVDLVAVGRWMLVADRAAGLTRLDLQRSFLSRIYLPIMQTAQ